MIKLQTIPKSEDRKPRVKTFSTELALKVLKKSKNWKIADGQKYIFKNGSILEKQPEKQTDKKL